MKGLGWVGPRASPSPLTAINTACLVDAPSCLLPSPAETVNCFIKGILMTKRHSVPNNNI